MLEDKVSLIFWGSSTFTLFYTCTESKNMLPHLCGCDSCTGGVVAATVVAAVVVVVGVDCCWGALVGAVVAGVAYRLIILIASIYTLLHTQVHNTAPTCGHTHARTYTRNTHADPPTHVTHTYVPTQHIHTHTCPRNTHTQHTHHCLRWFCNSLCLHNISTWFKYTQ